MKKFRFYCLLLACIALMPLRAQMQMPQLPIDKDVRMGKLDNGLTYYIRHNALPENRANFYIAQKVGSVQEEESQRGLAHFLEHMCFNGSDNFPGNSLIQFCERIGVKFGQNLNAYTSTDETVYNIDDVPVTDTNINPLYNPYTKTLRGGKTNASAGKTIVEPAAGRPYLDRNRKFKYKITRGDLCYRLFRKYGFRWGGDWKTMKDYQHFEK